MNENEFWERVQDLLHGNPLRWLSREVGLNQYTLQTSKNRNTIPKADTLQKIANIYDVSVEWLLSGDENYSEKDTVTREPGSLYHVPSKTFNEYETTSNEKIIYLPLLSQMVSTGYSTDLIKEIGTGEYIPVMKRLVAAYDSKSLRAVEAIGDSMTDINLMNGDIVIFSQNLVAGNGVYVISVDGEAFVKRLEIDKFQRVIKIHSENIKYPEPNIVPFDNEVMRIEGKVVAWFHCLP
ncbi:MAG: LexA family transcriptional regulator [Bacteroidetes bacterium]|nr:LexA family transcriptional regulator [Bacteroidota bacterium]